MLIQADNKFTCGSLSSGRVLVSKLVVKSVRTQQKFAVKNVVQTRKFVAFSVIRWYTIFAV